MRPVYCHLCHDRYADWAMQYIGEDKPSFYRLGYHIRGFKVTKVCDACKMDLSGELDAVIKAAREMDECPM